MTTAPSVAVLFDMDGVIIDSNPFIIKAWQHFCTKYHMPALTQEQLRTLVFGRITPEIVRSLLGNDLDPALIGYYADEVDEFVRQAIRAEGQLVGGLPEFLAELQTEGIPAAIATSAPLANVDVVLGLVEDKSVFRAIIDKSQVQRGKPDPQVYLTAAAALGMEPAQCVVLEDAFPGMEAGKRAGMKVVGITTTHTAEELRTVADLVIADFRELHVPTLRSLVGN